MCDSLQHAYNRGRRACLLAAELLAREVPAEDAREWWPSQREEVAKAAGVHKPSVETWGMACGVASVARGAKRSAA